MSNLRLLGGIRQSVTDDRKKAQEDATTSPRRQAQLIERYADKHDHTVAVWAEDLDTSGSVPPQDRPDLGKKLADLDSYDAVIFSKIDRLGRSVRDFANFLGWLEERGKSLIIIDPELDLTTPFGRAMAQIIVVFAELELEMIRARVREGFLARRADGRFSGMQFPYGYEPVALTFHPNGNPASWGYQPSEKYAPVVRTMIDMLLPPNGKSLGAVVRWLNAEGILTPRDAVREYYGNPVTGAEWRRESVTKILMSDNILGFVTDADGEILRDGDAMAVKRTGRDEKPVGAIADRDKVMQVREILKANADRQGPRENSSPLLRVAFCWCCGEPLYVNSTTDNGKVYRYYSCAVANRDATKCPDKRIPADWLENWLEVNLLAKFGPDELTETRTYAATDHSEAMAAIAGAIGHLSAEIALGEARGEDVSVLKATKADRQADLDRLADKPVEGPRTVTVGTGKTWEQRWRELGDDAPAGVDARKWRDSERNTFLRERGIQIEARKLAGGQPEARWRRLGWRVSDGGEPTGDYLVLAGT
jgi:site-specific DNA recombinase